MQTPFEGNDKDGDDNKISFDFSLSFGILHYKYTTILLNFHTIKKFLLAVKFFHFYSSQQRLIFDIAFTYCSEYSGLDVIRHINETRSLVFNATNMQLAVKFFEFHEDRKSVILVKNLSLTKI